MLTILALTALAADAPFKKLTLDRSFWGEGAAAADFNKDGKMDVFAGEVWYEQAGSAEKPEWRRHEVRTPRPRGEDFRKHGGPADGSPFDGGKTYSNSFGCFVQDFNADGYPDAVVASFPGEEWYWYENPKGQTGHWKAHLGGRSICNESPQWAELVPGGGKGLLMGSQAEPAGRMVYARPGKDHTQLWDEISLSPPKHVGTDRFYHGLGTGDLNGDGRADVVIPDGWWEQPAQLDGKPWKFHPAVLQPAKHTPPDPTREQRTMADLHLDDLNGDGLTDVIGSCAHRYGIWWFENLGPKEDPKFKPHVIREDISETHAMCYADLDGSGAKQIVTGKRYYSHMRSEPGSGDAAVVIAIKIERTPSGPKFVSRTLDEDSGVGTQFQTVDFNGDGKLDIVTANKKGVHVLLNP
jgi:hypothetical protein